MPKQITSVSSVSSVSSVEIVTPTEDLAATARRINAAIDSVTGHEEAFEDATLEHRLLIGQEILRAKAAFGLTRAQAGAIGGSSNAQPSPEDAPDIGEAHLGFQGWLKREIPRLPRPTAERYRTAFLGLGLGEDATQREITARVKTLRHEAGKEKKPMPTLKALYCLGRPPQGTPLQIQGPRQRPGLKLEDAREAAYLYAEAGCALVDRAHLDHLDRPGLETLKEHLMYMRDRVNARLKEL